MGSAGKRRQEVIQERSKAVRTRKKRTRESKNEERGKDVRRGSGHRKTGRHKGVGKTKEGARQTETPPIGVKDE